jgi:hypothetical protein
MRSNASREPRFGFDCYKIPFSQTPLGDFCNTIGPNATSHDVRFSAAVGAGADLGQRRVNKPEKKSRTRNQSVVAFVFRRMPPPRRDQRRVPAARWRSGGSKNCLCTSRTIRCTAPSPIVPGGMRASTWATRSRRREPRSRGSSRLRFYRLEVFALRKPHCSVAEGDPQRLVRLIKIKVPIYQSWHKLSAHSAGTAAPAASLTES